MIGRSRQPMTTASLLFHRVSIDRVDREREEGMGEEWKEREKILLFQLSAFKWKSGEKGREGQGE